MPQPRRILLLTPVIPPDPITGAARAGRFQRFLPEFGFEVDVVAEGPASSSIPGVVRVGRRPGDAPAPYLSRLAYLLRRMLSYDDQLPLAAHFFAAALQAVRARRYSAVVSTAPPMGMHVAALLLKKRCGLPAVCDFRDPLVGNPFRHHKGLIDYDDVLESFIARNADAVICNTNTAQQQFQHRHPSYAARCHLIWNGFEPEERAAQPAPPANSVRIIAHVGTLYGGRDPSALLHSLSRLASAGRLRRGEVLVRLAGPILPEMAVRLGDTFDPLVRQGLLEIDNRDIPRREAHALACSASGSLIIDTNDSQVSLQVPAKLFPSILLGYPVLALTYAGSPTESILARSGVPGCCIDPRWDPARIDAAVEGFVRLPSRSATPSDWFLKTFDGRQQVAELARILESCIEAAPRASA